LEPGRKVALQGLASSLALAALYLESPHSLSFMASIIKDWPLSVAVIFSHNVFAVSVISLCMVFYANLVALSRARWLRGANFVLRYPRAFSAFLSATVVLASVLKGAAAAGARPCEISTILLLSLPVMLMEGYGLYMAVKGALTRSLNASTLLHVYSIFFVAALLEASLIIML